MGALSRASFFTPHGRPCLFMVRDERDAQGDGFSTSDWNTANASAHGNDEYGIPSGLTGWALDVGAHIGSVTVPLLLDNPDLRVVAIEALPENVALLVQNLGLNDVSHRAIVIHAAASDSADDVRIGYGEVTDPTLVHEYIGNTRAPEGSRQVMVRGVTLRGAMLMRGPAQDEPFVWAKMDCESCEYAFLRSPHVASITYLTGEHHDGYARVASLLADTHDVRLVSGDEGFGHFVAMRRDDRGTVQ